MSDPYDKGVTWIVPCRRLAVQQTISYQDLMSRWLACLQHDSFGTKLKSWYSIKDVEYLAGQTAVANAVGAWATSSVPVSRRENAVDTGPQFLVRIWKGPMRVLLEERRGLAPQTTTPATGAPASTPAPAPTPASGPTATSPGSAPAPAPSSPSPPPPGPAPSPPAGASSGDSAAANETSTELQYGDKTLKLRQNERKEVVNRDAIFLMGDVVEFPLFTFLQLCGKDAYKDLEFDPMGSFLCGTSVRSKSGATRFPDSEPLLHDNLIAMRFQYMLNLLRGSFYDSFPTYNETGVKVPHAADSGSKEEVYARGVMYGAEMNSPHGEKDFYRLYAAEWGFIGEAQKYDKDNYPKAFVDEAETQQYAGNIPNQGNIGLGQLYISKDQTDSLRSDPPLTSAVSCSPATLFLIFYLHNKFGWGRSSVHDEFEHTIIKKVDGKPTKVSDSRLRDPEDWLTHFGANEVLGGESEADLEKQESDCSKDLLGKIDAIESYYTGKKKSFWMDALAFEKELSKLARADLAKAGKPGPHAMLDELKALRVKAQNGESLTSGKQTQDLTADEDGLDRITISISGELANWRMQLIDLKADACWASLDIPPPTYPTPPDPSSAADWKAIETSVKKKEPVTIRYAKDSLHASQGFLHRDMSSLFNDITVFNYPTHELGMIKLQRFDQIMTRNELPLSMGLGAYDPLSGVELVEPGMAAKGQIWHYEAGSTLPQWLGKKDNPCYQAPGISPFRWTEVHDNSLYVKKLGKDRAFCADYPMSGAWLNMRELTNAYTTKGNFLRSKYPRWADGQAGETNPVFKPIAIAKLDKYMDKTITRRRDLDQGKQKASVQKMVAERAVPFPTLTETFKDFNFPRISEVKTNADNLAKKLQDEVAAIDKRRDSYLKTLTWIKDSGFMSKVAKDYESLVKFLADKKGIEDKGVQLGDARAMKRFVAAISQLGLANLEKTLGTDKEDPKDTESKASKFLKRVTGDDSDAVKQMIPDFYTLAALTNVYDYKDRTSSFAAAIAPTWIPQLPALPAR